MKDCVEQTTESDANLNVDAVAHDAMRQGLASLPGSADSAPLPLPAVGSPGKASSIGTGLPTVSALPIGLGESCSVATMGVEDCDEEELKDLALQLKRSENLIKVGLQTLTPLQSHDEDWVFTIFILKQHTKMVSHLLIWVSTPILVANLVNTSYLNFRCCWQICVIFLVLGGGG